LEDELKRSLKTTYGAKTRELTRLAETHNLVGNERISDLSERYSKDYEKLGSRIGQIADKRKAAIDRAASDAAKAIY
jgi:hypothetical protein